MVTPNIYNRCILFCVNRDMEEDFTLDVDLRAFGQLRVGEHLVLHHDDVKAVNTEEHPRNVYPTTVTGDRVEGERATLHLPALSWNVIRLIP